MAVNWSWAWGSETALVLETSAGWDLSSTSAGNITPHVSGGAIEFSYVGSPTRYSLNMKGTSWARTPLDIGAPQGWISGHFYLNNPAGFSQLQMLSVYSTSGSRFIAAYSAVANTMKLYVDNVFKEQTVATFPPQTWHHIALQYDMVGGIAPGLTTTWSGKIYVNGVAVTGTQTDTSSVSQVSSYFRITGTQSGGTIAQGTYWSGLVNYDDMADPGSTSRFVTRVSPTADVSESGSWSPASGGTAQTTELASPLDAATTVTESTPATGENVVLNVNNLATQLGITPNIYGVSAHGYADGTGISLETAVGEGVTYTTGSSVVAGTATYATATAPTKPAGGNWAVTDTVLLKFEVS